MEERIILFSAGMLPGIPGTHGAGEYFVDQELRTIREVPVEEPPILIMSKRKQEKPVEPLPDITA